MLKTLLIVAMALALATGITAPAFAQDDAVKPLEIMSLGLGWIEPIDAAGYGAVIVGLKALPTKEPETVRNIGDMATSILANLSLDLIVTQDGMSLGASVPLTTMDATIEVRVGMAYVAEGWAFTVRGLLPTP